MAEGTTAIDTALTTEGDADGSELITYLVGQRAGIATASLPPTEGFVFYDLGLSLQPGDGQTQVIDHVAASDFTEAEPGAYELLITTEAHTDPLYPFGPGGFGTGLELSLTGEYRGDCAITCRVSYDDGATFAALGTENLLASDGGLTLGEPFIRSWPLPDGTLTSLVVEFSVAGAGALITTEGSVSPSGQFGALQYIGTHDEIAARKLAPPFWGRPFIAALLSAFMREIQRLEDTLWDILDIRTLANADLPRLKVLGKLVGQPRLGFSEESYRVLIEARGLANVSRGRGSDLLAALELLVGPGDYDLLEAGDATLLLTVQVPISAEDLGMLAQILPDTRAAGVGLQLLFSSATFADVFVWGDAWGAPEQWGSVRIL